VAHTTIVFARYIMLELARRSAKDPRTLGTLFHAGCDELRQASVHCRIGSLENVSICQQRIDSKYFSLFLFFLLTCRTVYGIV
jgi:hypothetical protein